MKFPGNQKHIGEQCPLQQDSPEIDSVFGAPCTTLKFLGRNSMLEHYGQTSSEIIALWSTVNQFPGNSCMLE